MKKTLNVVFKSYLYKNAIQDALKFIRRSAKDLDLDLGWDRERILHRIGLAEYEPGKAVFAGISFFALGALAGSVIGLALAPKKGEELRTQVKDKALLLFQRGQERANQPGAVV